MRGERRTRRGAALVAVLAALALAGCGRRSTPPPPRVDTPVQLPRAASTIVVPISARLADLAAGINGAVPRTLWQIDRVEPACVPAQRLHLFGRKLKVTPDLSCRIVGQVTRGPIRVSGAGDRLHLTLPVLATVSARDIGGVIKRETATGAASVSADVRLSIRPDWTPTAAVRISYDWTQAPGLTLFGKRITFTDKADAKLQKVVAGLERSLPRQLARLNARTQAAAAWREGFTAIELNHARPPVWMRVTPQSVSFGGYQIHGDRLSLTASARALTETFVGQRPPDPVPTPLPNLTRDTGTPALAFQVPVVADYRELEPVLARALGKLAAKGIVIPRLGPVDAQFGRVTMYATTGGRLAVGVEVKAKLRSGLIGTTTGQAWLTGMPYNAFNSEVVEVRDLHATATTDSRSVNLILALIETPSVLDTLRGALTQNFAKDYAKVLVSAKRAIAARRTGDFVLSARIDRVTHGRVVPTGQGLYLPLAATGAASISYRPVRPGA